MDVRSTVEALAADGVRVHCVQLGGMDLTGPSGKMMMEVINHVAEFEKDLLIERTNAGLERAKVEVKVLGRKPTLTPEQQATIRERRATGTSLGVLAKEFGVSRSAIQRVEKRAVAGVRMM